MQLLLGWKATRLLAEIFIKTLVKPWEAGVGTGSQSVGLTALGDALHVVSVFSVSCSSCLCPIN